MERRDFLAGAGAAATLAAAVPAAAQTGAPKPAARKKPFKLKYAPSPGHFKNHAPGGVLDEIRFAGDQGFTAWEDNGMSRRPPEEQEKIGAELKKRGMTMGIFVMNGPSMNKPMLTSGKAEDKEAFLALVKGSVDVAKRCGAKWMTSLVGAQDPKLPRGFQMANVIDCLRRASDILEPHGLVMVFEPLNIYENHPGFFIWRNDEMYALMKAVRSPSCKMLYDFYHSQISEGHLIYNFNACWDEIAYVQTGDVPGRKEPYTGETNYRNVFRHVYSKGYQGVVGMEHGISKPGKEGELQLIKAYRDADDFPVAAKKA